MPKEHCELPVHVIVANASTKRKEASSPAHHSASAYPFSLLDVCSWRLAIHKHAGFQCSSSNWMAVNGNTPTRQCFIHQPCSSGGRWGHVGPAVTWPDIRRRRRHVTGFGSCAAAVAVSGYSSGLRATRPNKCVAVHLIQSATLIRSPPMANHPSFLFPLASFNSSSVTLLEALGMQKGHTKRGWC